MCEFWLFVRLQGSKNGGNFVDGVNKNRYEHIMLSQFSFSGKQQILTSLMESRCIVFLEESERFISRCYTYTRHFGAKPHFFPKRSLIASI